MAIFILNWNNRGQGPSVYSITTWLELGAHQLQMMQGRHCGKDSILSLILGLKKY
jgi:hypothetical protein